MSLDEALQLLKEKKTDEFMAIARPLAAAVLAPEKPVPPPLEGSAADIALQLRDAYRAACRRDSRLTRSFPDARGAGRIFLECCHDDDLGLSAWLLWHATPYEQIAVCLEALNLFEKEKP